jgi:hypothetical protein
VLDVLNDTVMLGKQIEGFAVLLDQTLGAFGCDSSHCHCRRDT